MYIQKNTSHLLNDLRSIKLNQFFEHLNGPKN